MVLVSFLVVNAHAQTTFSASPTPPSQDVVFAVLLHRNQIVSLVRMKGQMLHPMDLHLIVNLVSSTQALKDAQTHWIPICLPKFDAK